MDLSPKRIKDNCILIHFDAIFFTKDPPGQMEKLPIQINVE